MERYRPPVRFSTGTDTGTHTSLNRCQSRIEHINHEICVCLSDAQRRFDSKSVRIETAFTEKQSQIPCYFMHTGALIFCRFFCGAVSDQLNAEHQAFATNFANNIVLLRQFAEPLDKVISDTCRVLLQLFAIDHLKHRPTLCAHDRISAERIEMNSFGETLRNLRRRDYSAEGSAVSDPFCHGYDVWYHTLTFKSPIRLAGTAKTSLDFVSYANASRLSHMLIHMPEITIREYNGSANSLN